jgi:hypothetical protein
VLGEGPSSYQNLAFVEALGAASHPLSSGVAHAHGGGLVELRWSFFFLSLFSFMPLKFAPNLSKKNCVLQFAVLPILTLLLFYCYLFDFLYFLKFSIFFFLFHHEAFYSI